MARQIAPGTPSEINAKLVDVKMPSFDAFDKLGDAEIKAANVNFTLYAKTLLNTESQKLYEQFKTDPIQLSNALGKLPDMLNDLPEELKEQMTSDFMLNSISLVQKAQQNQKIKQREETKINAKGLAETTGQNIADDFSNLLVYFNSPTDQQRLTDLSIYVKNRLNLAELAELQDDEGKNIFSDKEREIMKMPTKAITLGFEQFINRFELKDLQDWDKNQFQDRDDFKKKTHIDDATYDTLESKLKNRIKALQDDKSRQIHGQAYYDALSLITEPTQANIDRIKEEGVINSGVIDKVVKASKKATEKTYAYDPNRRTSPSALFKALASFSTIVNNNDWNFDGREKALGQAAESLAYLSDLSQQTNMSPELVDSLKKAIYTTLINKESANALAETNAIVFNNVAPNFDVFGDISERSKSTKELFKSSLKSGAYSRSKEKANDNLEKNLAIAMNTYNYGNIDAYKDQVNQAVLQYKRDLVDFMGFSSSQWNNWQKDIENGKEVVIEYMGNRYRFNGFNAQKPFTQIGG